MHEIGFHARVNQLGETDFDFDTIKNMNVIHFLSQRLDAEQPDPVYYSLHGKAQDGTTLDTSDLHLKTQTRTWHKDTGFHMSVTGSSTRTVFRRKLPRPAPKPMLRVLVNGFRDCSPLSATCRLGTIQMAGATSRPGPDITTGSIELSPEDVPADLHAWRSQAEELLEHVRLIMSFGSGAMLRAPIVEFWTGEDVEVTALSQTRPAVSPIRTFDFMRQRHAFDVAVNSFFSPKVKIKNLFFAIEWLVMETTYNEVRLINAMTALENILASNLTHEDSFIQPVDPGADEAPEGKFEDKNREEKFEKETRPALQKVMSRCLKDLNWSSEARGDVYGKLGELNRRTFLQKFKILVERWSVPLDGISDEKIQAAKEARDNIVHRGHFQEGHKTRDWEHVTVVREIVVRFILTAIDYKGEYGCYIGAPHYAQFPPGVSDDPSPERTAME